MYCVPDQLLVTAHLRHSQKPWKRQVHTVNRPLSSPNSNKQILQTGHSIFFLDSGLSPAM